MESKIIKVWFDAELIFIKTSEGETKSHPLEWFPKLKNATDEERKDFDLSPFGIHWLKLDEDLSLEGFYNYKQ